MRERERDTFRRRKLRNARFSVIFHVEWFKIVCCLEEMFRMTRLVGCF